MKLPDRVKESTVTVGTGPFALGGAATGFQTFAAALTVGDTVPYCATLGSEWEVGIGTLTAAATLVRTSVTSSSNGGNLVNFSAGTKEIFASATASVLSKFTQTGDLPFATSVPLTISGSSYMPQQSVSSVLAFTPAASAVKGALVYLRLVADGVNAPTFTGFKEWGGSLGYDNRSGIVNQLQFFYDGYDYWYTVSQQVGAAAVDATAPTALSASVANATPTFVDIVLSEAMDTSYTPAASSITVGGHTVSALAFTSSTNMRATVTTAFVNGEAASPVSYAQPGTNNARDLAGNLLANFSGLAVTNNVGAVATAPAQMAAPTATAGDGTVSVAYVAPSNGGSAITGYTATWSGGQSATGTANPLVITGVTNDVVGTVTIVATNAVGNSPASPASNSVTPVASGGVSFVVDLQNLTNGLTLTAPGEYSGGGNGITGTGGRGNGGALKIPANTDGYVSLDWVSPATQCAVGLDSVTNVPTYDNMDFLCWLYTSAGTLYASANTSAGTSKGPYQPVGAGVRYRVARISGAVTLDLSTDSGATWTTKHTFVASGSTVALYPVWFGEAIHQPRGSGLA